MIKSFHHFRFLSVPLQWWYITAAFLSYPPLGYYRFTFPSVAVYLCRGSLFGSILMPLKIVPFFLSVVLSKVKMGYYAQRKLFEFASF